jgi:hypothetical protein
MFPYSRKAIISTLRNKKHEGNKNKKNNSIKQ